MVLSSQLEIVCETVQPRDRNENILNVPERRVREVNQF